MPKGMPVVDLIHKEGLPIAGQIASGEGVTLTVRGGCMQPVLLSGDAIRVIKRRFYLPGDILVFCGLKKTITVHRFLGMVPTVKGRRYLTQADNAVRPDGLVHPHDIIGKVTHIVSLRVGLEITGGDRFHAVYKWFVFATKTILLHLWGSENGGEKNKSVKLSDIRKTEASICELFEF